MRKLLIPALALMLLTSCASRGTTALFFSPTFRANIPESEMIGGIIFQSEELSLKTAEGRSISGKTLSNDSEDLPGDFDIHKYPEYLFGVLEIPASLPSSEKFSASKMEIDHTYGIENLRVLEGSDSISYLLCKSTACLAFVVSRSFHDHILTIHSNGYSEAEFTRFIRENVDVKR